MEQKTTACLTEWQRTQKVAPEKKIGHMNMTVHKIRGKERFRKNLVWLKKEDRIIN